MFKNYFNVAFRNLVKHKFYSFINVSGLSIGITCFLLISLYVLNELKYDTFHRDADTIYRMDFAGNINGSEFIIAQSSAPAATTLKEEYPEVLDATRFRNTGNWIIRRKEEDNAYNEDDVIFADKNFFEFWDFELVSGDPKSCLERPNTLAISQTLATKIFGDQNPIGEIVILDNKEDWEVTAVYEDMPSISHFSYEMLLSMENTEDAKSKMWMSFNFNTYLKLQAGFNPKELEAKFPPLIEKYIGPEIQKFLGASLDEFFEAGNSMGFSLFPLIDIHLYSDKMGELGVNGDFKYIIIFTAIALFILILACINFMNLSTARSAG
ncbi:MAG: ABC transporter permease, partial [Bacteroidota bacterium]